MKPKKLADIFEPTNLKEGVYEVYVTRPRTAFAQNAVRPDMVILGATLDEGDHKGKQVCYSPFGKTPQSLVERGEFLGYAAPKIGTGALKLARQAL